METLFFGDGVVLTFNSKLASPEAGFFSHEGSLRNLPMQNIRQKIELQKTLTYLVAADMRYIRIERAS